MFSKLLAAATALSGIVGFSGSAHATDPIAPSTYNWSGLYAGVTAGYGSGKYHQYVTGYVEPNEHDMAGFVGGGTFGYNTQIDQIVLGIETDLSISGIGGTNSTDSGWTCDGPEACSTDINWLGTARARLGFAVDRFMPFITAGVAYAGINSGDGPTTTNVFSRFDKVQFGWTAGVGIEAALSDTMTMKAEVLYVDLGNVESGNANGFGVYPDFTVARVGFNFRF